MTLPTSSSRIALVSMPWSLFNRPSIQLGGLKAYLEQRDGMSVHCYHPYLAAARAIGVETYTLLSQNSWAGEALYSAILYPKKHQDAEKVFTKNCRDTPALLGQFQAIKTQLEEALEDWLAATNFNNYAIIGFSVCFSQLFASLAAAERVKQQAPEIRVVFGGSSCVGSMGTSLLQSFSQIDHIIEGEGEQQFAALCWSLTGIQDSKAAHPQRQQDQYMPAHGGIDLDTLPIPDYRDYFSELDRIFSRRPFSPVLPIEFSRGCWWHKCTFCNLNLQWNGYRKKQADKLLAEIRELHNRHQCLDFTFCDNALPPAESDRFFEATAHWDIDINFFAEIRAVGDPQKLSFYNRGGLRNVQVGIEALSSSLLAKMEKGARVIDNLAVMKYCLQYGIQLDGNLIVEFPGTSQQEIDETLNTLDYVLPFRPLSAATFFLGQGSPIERDPQRFGIHSTARHPYYSSMLPSDILEQLDVLIKDYRGDKTVQQKMWSPVRRKITQWQDFHTGRDDSSLPPLSYRDGGSFLIIRQERPDDKPLLHRLKGNSRKLFLFCNVVKNINDILLAFPGLKKQTVLNFFDDLGKKRLLFRENDDFLALAVPAYRKTR